MLLHLYSRIAPAYYRINRNCYSAYSNERSALMGVGPSGNLPLYTVFRKKTVPLLFLQYHWLLLADCNSFTVKIKNNQRKFWNRNPPPRVKCVTALIDKKYAVNIDISYVFFRTKVQSISVSQHMCF